MYSTRFVFSGIDNFDLIREMFKNNIDSKSHQECRKIEETACKNEHLTR
jgi:hypothetical protein